MSSPIDKLTVREICTSVVVNATVADLWHAWSTTEGATTFFAPRAHILLAPGGAYELFFDPTAPVGQQGSEGCSIVEFQPEQYLCFTWNFPPSIPSLREKHTTVGVGLQAVQGGKTRVVLTQTGWSIGEDWSQGFSYFQRAWKLVLARLKHRFESAPIDWSNPYEPPDP